MEIQFKQITSLLGDSAIEAMAGLIPNSSHKKDAHTKIASEIKYCRTCYDHLAGKVSVAVTDSLLKQKIIVVRKNTFELTSKGEKWFCGFDIRVGELKEQRRSFLRPCLDWSERRDHIAGSLATALLDMMLSEHWIRKIKNSRAVVVTGTGQRKLHQYFKLDL